MRMFQSQTRISQSILMMCLTGMIGIGSGCEKRHPIIEKPQRPIMLLITADDIECLDEDVREQLITNDKLIKHYARRLEARIDIYNDWAEHKNTWGD